jgi:hypothetical protein
MFSALRKAPLVLLLLAGCSKSETVPAYLEIPSVVLITTPEQGVATSKVTDVWVSVNDRLVGVWELPARIPVIGEGSNRITVVPAIKRNGMYDDRLRYPFFASWSGSVELSEQSTVSIAPTTSYFSTTDIWIESFDDIGMLVETSDPADTLIRFTVEEHPTLVRDDTPCGGARLTSSNPSVRIQTDQDFLGASGPVFLELDFSTDVQLVVGVRYNNAGFDAVEPVVVLTPTTPNGNSPIWNKVYIDLSALFNTGAVNERDIYIEGALSSGMSSGLFLVDNIKLVRSE